MTDVPENVKQAWWMWHTDGDENVNIEACPDLSLSEALDLLAWVASEPTPPVHVTLGTFLDGDEFCTTIEIWDTIPTDPNRYEPGERWWQNPLGQAIGNEQFLEHILRAIDAIVDKHPEVVE